ncbi:hypothetical protein ScPMuIL_003012 [Solemya velum]
MQPWVICLIFQGSYLYALPIYKVALVLEDGIGLSFDLPKSGPAVELGKQILVDAMDGIVDIQFVDSFIKNDPYACKVEDIGAMTAALYYEQKMNGIIGPGCSASVEIIGLMAATWNLPMLSPLASKSSLANKNLYKTLTRMASDYKAFGNFFVSFFGHFNWTDISIIHDQSHTIVDTILSNFQEIFEDHGITSTSVVYRPGMSYQDVLKVASRTARVFLFVTYPDTFRHFMVEAHKLDMTGGDYAMISIRHFEMYGRGDQLLPFEGDSLDATLEQASECVLIADRWRQSGPTFEAYSKLMKQQSKDVYNYTYGDQPIMRVLQEYTNAFTVLANALKKTIDDGEDIFDGRNVMKHMWDVALQGVTRMVVIDDNGDRGEDFTVYDFHNGEYKLVAENLAVKKRFEVLPYSTIQWPGGRGPPPNTPSCGFLGDLPHCQTYELPTVAIIAIVFCSILLTISITGAVLYKRMKLENELHKQWWKINWRDVIEKTDSTFPLYSSCRSLKNNDLGDSVSQPRQTFTKVAIYMGAPVAVNKLTIKHLQIERESLVEIRQMKSVNCPNLTKFVGLVTEDPHVCILMEYCSKGSLEDILQNDSIQLDKNFKVSLITDILQAMNFIHSGSIGVHGRLNSSNCVIDSRFTVKVTGYGLRSIRNQGHKLSGFRNERYLFWVAPEHLRTNPDNDVSASGDVYSFAIILYEIITRDSPYNTGTCTVQEIVEKIKAAQNPPFRPSVDVSTIEKPVMTLIKECWHENPIYRPTFRQIRNRLKDSKWATSEGNFFDSLIRRMEQYANNLEGLVNEKTQAFLEEKRKAEVLLYHILPKSVADQLKNGASVDPEAFESVTVYFSDIVGFTSISAESSPIEVVDLLNDLYTCFDDIIENYDVYKVETIGDAYMVVSGLPIRNGVVHAREIARLSLSILESVGKFKIRHKPNMPVKARIGIHSGSVCSGVVGKKMPRYCLFGDTVNTASRMESNGEGERARALTILDHEVV